MSAPTKYVKMESLLQSLTDRLFVVIRWVHEHPSPSNVHTPSSTLDLVSSLGYNIGDTSYGRVTSCPIEGEQFLIIPMGTAAEAEMLVNNFVRESANVENTRYQVNPLVGPKGVRLQDLTDCVRLWHENFEDNDLMELMLAVIGMEGVDKRTIIERELPLITQGIAELVENGVCQFFGSYISPIRRNGYSDIDINVESIDTKEKQGSGHVRPLQHLLEDPLCLIGNPLTKAELYTFPPEEIIKALFKCFSQNKKINETFTMRYLPARTPIIMFNGNKDGEYDVSFDVSVNNKFSTEKGEILDHFMRMDRSPSSKARKVMQFLVHWAKANQLMGGVYPEEKLKTKTRFNSYVINQMVIHFFQAYANKDLVFPKAKIESRVVSYNFDEMFTDYQHFLKEFFKYFANFDFIGMAIYGRKKLQKKTVSKVHGVPESPLMIMDPMDVTHNLTAKVPEDAVKLLNGLIRNALLILKQKPFRLSLLLRTNHIAALLMENKNTHTCNTTSQLPSALSEFASVCGDHKVLLTFQLPSVIQTSLEFMTLLTKVLRFQVSPNQAGPSVDNLYNSKGVAFVVHARTWIGRRNMKRAIKNEHPELSNLKVEILCSASFKFEEEPIAEFRLVMTDTDANKTHKIGYIEMLKGQMNEMRDAMHYLVDQFLANNMAEIEQNGGIGCIDTAGTEHSDSLMS